MNNLSCEWLHIPTTTQQKDYIKTIIMLCQTINYPKIVNYHEKCHVYASTTKTSLRSVPHYKFSALGIYTIFINVVCLCQRNTVFLMMIFHVMCMATIRIQLLFGRVVSLRRCYCCRLVYYSNTTQLHVNVVCTVKTFQQLFYVLDKIPRRFAIVNGMN